MKGLAAKWFPSLLCAFAVGSSFAAEPVELKVWQGFKEGEIALLKENIASFEKAEAAAGRAVRVTTEQVPFDPMVQKIKTAAMARQTPDIAFVDANKMVPLAYGGAALRLDTLPTFPAKSIEELGRRFTPGAFSTNVLPVKGVTGLYGMPAQTTCLVLYWNKAMFRQRAAELRKAGCDPDRAPADWEEFERYGKALTKPETGVYGFAYENEFWFTIPFLNQYGVGIVKKDEAGALAPDLATARGEAAVQRKAGLYKAGIEAGAWKPGAVDPPQGFANGKYAMILTGPWNVETFRRQGLDFGVALIPAVPLAEAKALGLAAPDTRDDDTTARRALSASNIGGQNMVVMTSCRHPDTALAFLLHMSGEAVQRQWTEKLGQIPVNRAAQTGLDLRKFPEVETFMAQANLVKPFMPLPQFGMLTTDIFNPEMALVLQGQQAPKQALARMESRMKALILDPVNAAAADAAARR